MAGGAKDSHTISRKSPQIRRKAGWAVLFSLSLSGLAADWPQATLHWAGPQVTLLGSPSPDGSRLSYADPSTGALGVRDLRTGTSQEVATREAGSREFAYFSAFSRDGASIAYAWFNRDGFYEVRLAPATPGGPVKVIYRNEQAGFVQPCSWTPDNKHILTLLFRRDNTSQIALIPRDGGQPRILRSLQWVYPKRMDLSPDGRWIVYDNFAVEGKPQRGLFLLSLDGSREMRIPGLPANALFPLWAPDGSSVYFAGDDGGAQRVWRVAVSNGAAAGKAESVSSPMGRLLLLGIAAGDRLFFGMRTGDPDIFLATEGVGIRMPSQWGGRNSAPSFSADGTQLAYLSRRGAENFGQQSRSIVVRRISTGEEREIDPRMAHIERLVWSPDGKVLLASGSDGKGRAGLFTVRVEDGATAPLAAAHDGPFRGYEAVWGRDGKSIYYLRGENELVQREIAGAAEKVLLRTALLRHLAIAPDEDTLAVGVGDVSIRITPLGENTQARLVSFPGLTDLSWGRQLLAGRGPEIWQVPLDGSAPQRVLQAKDRAQGFSAARDGRIAFTIGTEQNQIASIPVKVP